VQWPTLLTLAMFPILVVMYVRLAKTEERQAIGEFGSAYTEYAREVPGFIPRLTRLFSQRPSAGYGHGR
jgi:protein-S-isoprenylcysteine O-methyltransferase Ste14